MAVFVSEICLTLLTVIHSICLTWSIDRHIFYKHFRKSDPVAMSERKFAKANFSIRLARLLNIARSWRYLSLVYPWDKNKWNSGILLKGNNLTFLEKLFVWNWINNGRTYRGRKYTRYQTVSERTCIQGDCKMFAEGIQAWQLLQNSAAISAAETFIFSLPRVWHEKFTKEDLHSHRKVFFHFHYFVTQKSSCLSLLGYSLHPPVPKKLETSSL